MATPVTKRRTRAGPRLSTQSATAALAAAPSAQLATMRRASRPHVGQIPERAHQRAQDEAELDGDGQRGGARITEMPLARQRGEHGGGAEPERQREQLRDGEKEQRAPPGRR